MKKHLISRKISPSFATLACAGKFTRGRTLTEDEFRDHMNTDPDSLCMKCKKIFKMVVLAISISIISLSCGVSKSLDKVERPFNDLMYNNKAFIVEYRYGNFIYARSGGGMYTYKIEDKWGVWDEVDTILVRDYPKVTAHVVKITVNY